MIVRSPQAVCFSTEEFPVDDRIEQNRRSAQKFYDLLFNRGDPVAAVEEHVGDVYIQHNPMVADGKEPFIAYFQKMAKHWDVLQVVPKTAANDNTMF